MIEKFVKGKGWVLDMDAVRKDMECAYVTDGGVVRWKSNDSVPFDDMLAAFQKAGLDLNMAASSKAREEESLRFLEDYRRRMANHVPSEEELFEMRAAFGEGTTVVNVLTGRKTQL